MLKNPIIKDILKDNFDYNIRNIGNTEKEKQETKKSANTDSSKPELIGIETFIQLIKDGKLPRIKFTKEIKGINEDSGYNSDSTNRIKP